MRKIKKYYTQSVDGVFKYLDIYQDGMVKTIALWHTETKSGWAVDWSKMENGAELKKAVEDFWEYNRERK